MRSSLQKSLEATALTLGLAGCAWEAPEGLTDPSEVVIEDREAMPAQVKDVHHLLHETPAGCHIRNMVASTISTVAGLAAGHTIIQGPGYGGLPQGNDLASMHNFNGPQWYAECFQNGAAETTHPLVQPIELNEHPPQSASWHCLEGTMQGPCPNTPDTSDETPFIDSNLFKMEVSRLLSLTQEQNITGEEIASEETELADGGGGGGFNEGLSLTMSAQ